MSRHLSTSQPIVRTRMTPAGEKYFQIGKDLAAAQLARHALAVRRGEYTVLIDDVVHYLEQDEACYLWVDAIPSCPSCGDQLVPWNAKQDSRSAPILALGPGDPFVACECEMRWPVTECR